MDFVGHSNFDRGMNSYTGNLPGSGKTITASAQCIVYDHKRETVYVSTYDRHLARDVVRTQSVRDPDGEYRAYELMGEDWREVRTRVKLPAPVAPPFFHLFAVGFFCSFPL